MEVVVAVTVVAGSPAARTAAATAAPASTLGEGGLVFTFLSLDGLSTFAGREALIFTLSELEVHLGVLFGVEAGKLNSLLEDALLDLFALVVGQVDPEFAEVESLEEEPNDGALLRLEVHGGLLWLSSLLSDGQGLGHGGESKCDSCEFHLFNPGPLVTSLYRYFSRV